MTENRKSLGYSQHELDCLAIGLPPAKATRAHIKDAVDQFLSELNPGIFITPKCTVTGDIEKQTITTTFTSRD